MKPALMIGGEIGAATGAMVFALSDGFVAWTALIVAAMALGVSVWAAEDDPDEPPDASPA
jgi:hypothetical protein